MNARDTTFGHADRFDEKYDLVRTFRKGTFRYMRNYQPFNFDGLHNFYRYKMLAYRQWRDMYHAGELNAEQSQFFECRPVEANLILNSAALLATSKPGYKFDLDEFKSEEWATGKKSLAKRRIEYLALEGE